MDDPGNNARPPSRSDRAGPPPKVDGRPPVPGRREQAAAPPDEPPGPRRPAPAPTPVTAGAVTAAPTGGTRSPEVAPAPPPPARRSLFRKAEGAPSGPIWLSPADLAPAGIPDVVPVTPAPRPAAHRLPAAPEPPFTRAAAPYRWEATLPSAIGRTITFRVGAAGVELGGTSVAFDEIEVVRFKLQVEAALFRQAASARMSVAVTRLDGTTVRASARNALSTRRAEDVVSVLGYLWTVFGDTVAERPRARMVARIGQGAEVVAGGLRLTRIGVAWKKRPIEPWGAIGDPVVERRSVVIPTSGDPIEVPLAADDVYVLPGLIPELRARFR